MVRVIYLKTTVKVTLLTAKQSNKIMVEGVDVAAVTPESRRLLGPMYTIMLQCIAAQQVIIS